MNKAGRIVIPVVFSTDYKYLVPTSVAIISMLENANENTYYMVYLLVESIDYAKIQKYAEAINRKYSNCSIILKCIDEKLFKTAQIRNEYLTVATYYRLVIDQILTEYDKCIYLDGDILVLQDLQQLYNQEMEDNYVQGVKAWNMYRESEMTKNLEKELGIQIVDSYINAGVLVMNLKKMRKDNMQQQLLDCLGKKYRFEDQDIINQKCFRNIGYLPEKYNVYSIFYKTPQILSEFLDNISEGLSEQVTNPVILHFSGMYVKPWENNKCKGAREWYYYLKKVQSIENLFYEFKYEQMIGFKQNWENMCEFCLKFRSIYIWGYTPRNILLKRTLADMHIAITGFIDNNSLKWGEHENGESVFSVQSVTQQNFVGIIITSRRFIEAMKFQLNELSFPDSHVWVYDRLDKWYYMGLDPVFYKTELDDILLVQGIIMPQNCKTSLNNQIEYLRKNEEQWKILESEYEFDVWLKCIGNI